MQGVEKCPAILAFGDLFFVEIGGFRGGVSGELGISSMGFGLWDLQDFRGNGHWHWRSGGM